MVGYPLLWETGSPLVSIQPCSPKMTRSFTHPQHNGGWGSQAGVVSPQEGHYLSPVIHPMFLPVGLVMGLYIVVFWLQSSQSNHFYAYSILFCVYLTFGQYWCYMRRMAGSLPQHQLTA